MKACVWAVTQTGRAAPTQCQVSTWERGRGGLTVNNTLGVCITLRSFFS